MEEKKAKKTQRSPNKWFYNYLFLELMVQHRTGQVRQMTHLILKCCPYSQGQYEVHKTPLVA